MEPALSPHCGGRALVATVAALAAAAALGTGCGGNWDNTGSGTHRATTMVFPATTTVSAPELVRLWEAHSLPCEHPIGINGTLADPYNLLETAMWPDTADVAARLTGVTATGGQEFILGRLQVLGAVVLQTQSDIAEQVTTGTHEIDTVGGDPTVETVIRDQSRRTIKLRHDNYVAAVNHVIGELTIGATLPSAQLGRKYRLERVCPDR